jgi:hypothetical protein
MLWFLVNDQRDAHFFAMYLFLFLTLYMFRAPRANHQERQIVSTQPLCHPVSVVVSCGGRKWVQFRPTHDTANDREWQLPEVVLTVFLSWWWARCARNLLTVKNKNKNKNKYIVKNCASRWPFTKNCSSIWFLFGNNNLNELLAMKIEKKSLWTSWIMHLACERERSERHNHASYLVWQFRV